MPTPNHIACYDSVTGAQVTRPRTWVDNPRIHGGRFTSTKPKKHDSDKSSRVKRDTVDASPATPAELTTDAPSAGDNTKE